MYKSLDMYFHCQYIHKRMACKVCRFKGIPSTRCTVEAHLDPTVHAYKKPWLVMSQTGCPLSVRHLNAVHLNLDGQP